jgi:hypothetical protein
MDSARSVDIDLVRRDMEATRASISRTAGELRWKAGEAMQWQTYVERYPAPILAAVALLGVAVGRRIGRGFNGSADRGSGRPWTSAAAGMDSVARVPARLEPEGDRLAAVTAAWQKLGSRVEGLVNRVIDEVADAAERALVPALIGGVQAFFDGRAAGPAAIGCVGSYVRLVAENAIPANGRRPRLRYRHRGGAAANTRVCGGLVHGLQDGPGECRQQRPGRGTPRHDA